MGPIDPETALKLQSELMSSESVLWAGRPDPKIILHADDWYLIPFSFLWGGFAIFWEAGVLGYWGNTKGTPWTFGALWGIPFVVAGQYLIWGRFFYDAWLKRRTYYGVTNRRVIVLQEGWRRKTGATYLDAIPTIDHEGSDTGTLWFGNKLPLMTGRGQQSRGWSRFSVGAVPTFADIDDMDSIYRLVSDLREQTTRRDPTFAR